MRSSVLVFDVNETLLDLGALAPAFQRFFGAPEARGEWFVQLLRSSMVATVTGSYENFATLARGALEMVASRRGITLTADARREILQEMRRLPPHEEVPAALERLARRGFRLAALTNSPPEVAEAQIQNAGLKERFEAVLSVDAVRKFKPHPDVYRYAARSLGVEISRMRLIAAHDWDTTGALRAGAQAAFIARPGMVLDPLGPTPDIIGGDLTEVADQLLDLESPRR